MNTMLMYGRTGSTKSSQLGNIAIKLRELYQKRGIENPVFRYIGADSGWGPMDDIVKSAENPDGFVETLDISMLKNPFGVLNAVADGRWLQLGEDPKTKQPRLEFTQSTRLPNGVCGIFVEGLNSIADACLQDHVNENRKIGQDLASKATIYAPVVGGTQASYTIGSAGQSHYGQVQRWLLSDLLPKLKSLKREDGTEVPWLVMTAHEAEGSDDFSKTVLGPASVGRAMVGATPQKFQDCIHMVKLVDAKTGAREIRAYFWDHPEPSMPVAGGFMLWPAKVSFPPKVTMAINKKWQNGYIPMVMKEGPRGEILHEGVEQIVEFRFNLDIGQESGSLLKL